MKELIDSLHELGLSENEARMLNVLLVVNRPINAKGIREIWPTLSRTQVYAVLKKLKDHDLVKCEEFIMKNIKDKPAITYFIVDKFEIPLSKLVKNKTSKLEDNLNKAIKTMEKIKKGINI